MPEYTPQQIAEWKLQQQIQSLVAAANNCAEPAPTPDPVAEKKELKIREPKYVCRNCGRAKKKRSWYCSECKASMKAARHEKGSRRRTTKISSSTYYNQNHQP